MPIDDILAILIPVELHFMPQFINLCTQLLLFLITIFEILADTK